VLKRALAAGEEQLGRTLGQVLSGPGPGAALQGLFAAAGQARERLDRTLRAALDAAQVPSSQDVDELKRRLAEMEELLDGLAARMARTETGAERRPGPEPRHGAERSGAERSGSRRREPR
jgi:hypothetical protein